MFHYGIVKKIECVYVCAYVCEMTEFGHGYYLCVYVCVCVCAKKSVCVNGKKITTKY